MTPPPAPDRHAFLGQEWSLLQHQYERQESHALAVRLAALALYLAGWALGLDAVAAAVLTLLLWAQEGMVRAWQNRAGERLLRIESQLRGEAPALPAFQLHSEWAAGRPGTVGLLAEYAAQAARPTVAFFYVVLLALLAAPWG